MQDLEFIEFLRLELSVMGVCQACCHKTTRVTEWVIQHFRKWESPHGIAKNHIAHVNDTLDNTVVYLCRRRKYTRSILPNFYFSVCPFLDLITPCISNLEILMTRRKNRCVAKLDNFLLRENSRRRYTDSPKYKKHQAI